MSKLNVNILEFENIKSFQNLNSFCDKIRGDSPEISKLHSLLVSVSVSGLVMDSPDRGSLPYKQNVMITTSNDVTESTSYMKADSLLEALSMRSVEGKRTRYLSFLLFP